MSTFPFPYPLLFANVSYLIWRLLMLWIFGNLWKSHLYESLYCNKVHLLSKFNENLFAARLPSSYDVKWLKVVWFSRDFHTKISIFHKEKLQCFSSITAMFRYNLISYKFSATSCRFCNINSKFGTNSHYHLFVQYCSHGLLENAVSEILILNIIGSHQQDSLANPYWKRKLRAVDFGNFSIFSISLEQSKDGISFHETVTMTISIWAGEGSLNTGKWQRVERNCNYIETWTGPVQR